MHVFVRNGTVKGGVCPGKEAVFFEGATIEALLSHLALSPETVLVEKGGEIVPEQSILCEGDEVSILEIISGG